MKTPTSTDSARAPQRRSEGAALLMVLWLAAALSAIAFTLANTVRGEIERSSTDADGLKAYYLAEGAIDRMLVYIESGAAFVGPDGKPRFQFGKTHVLNLDFPTGVARVEYIPENSKLNVNAAPPAGLMQSDAGAGRGSQSGRSDCGGHPGLARRHARRIVYRVRSILLVAHSVFSRAACVSSGD